ncbi:MAG: HAD-IB family phosphatase [Nitrososphaerales archaeon]
MNKKLVAFDMDGTLLNGRLVFALGDRYGKSDMVREIMNKDIDCYEKSRQIAQLWHGLSASKVMEAIKLIPSINGASEVIDEFKKRGYKIGIISDSYTLATDYIVKKFKMHFHVANILEVKDGSLTGKIEMSLGWEKIGCWCRISVCKRYHLEKLASSMGITLQDTIAIGDTKNDLCMIDRAGI